MARGDSTKTKVALPEELAPTLRRQVDQLLSEVSLARAWWIPRPVIYRPNRCVVCYQSGKLGGHHGRDGRIEWVHKSCHRRLHRKQRAAA